MMWQRDRRSQVKEPLEPALSLFISLLVSRKPDEERNFTAINYLSLIFLKVLQSCLKKKKPIKDCQS